MTEGNATFGQVVRGEFQSDLVASKDANAISAKPAGQVSQDYAFVFQLDAKKAARKFFENRASNFNAVLFAHRPPG